MRQRIHIFYFIFCVVLLSCKKKEPEPELESEDPCITKYNAMFTIDQRFVVNNGIAIQDGRYPKIYLSKQNCGWKAPSSVQGGSISFDSKNLPLYNPNFWSTTNTNDTTSQTKQPPFTWNSSGSPEFPSFTEVIVDSIPVFYNSQSLPDTVLKSGNTLIQLGGKNANNILISIETNTNNPHSTRISASSAVYGLAIPSYIPGNTTGTLTISYERSFIKDIQGVKAGFYLLGTYRKQVHIKN